MPNETLATGPVGWYGKLPAAGDFLRHGLPEHFVTSWDAWLRAGMAAGATRHGENWEGNFLRFPVWFFLRYLQASQQAPACPWAGLLVPSVDRVGRLFPLTVAFDLPAATFMHMDIESIEQRLHDIASHTLKVLGNDDLPAFECALTAVEPLAARPAPARATLSGLIDHIGRQALLESLVHHTVFWMADHQSGNDVLILPEPLQAEAFMKLVLPSLSPVNGD